ncbi:MAG: hypothetical protein GY792_28160 [Gammaproteobacteria bacterium]|nr:hypothetical protein [Gammaproteobacteria bacterium]
MVITVKVAARYTLQAQATDRAGNLSAVVESLVTVDFSGPEVQAASATPAYLNMVGDLDHTTLHATIVDLTGVVEASATVNDIDGSNDWTHLYTRVTGAPNDFELPVPDTALENATEGRKTVTITAEDWLGNESVTETDGFIVDKTDPVLIGDPVLLNAGENLYLPDGLTLYHGPQSTDDSVLVTMGVDDTNPNADAVAGLDYVTFPEVFGDDGENEPQDGVVTTIATHVYTADGNPHVGHSSNDNEKTITATDRATNESGISPAFTVYWDPNAPNMSNFALTITATKVYQRNATTLYYGPDAFGDMRVSVVAIDNEAGMRHVVFPDMFDAGAHTVVDANGNTYGRTYTVDGSETTNGEFTLTAVDNVGNVNNTDPDATFLVLKDEEAPDLTGMTLSENSPYLHATGTIMFYGPGSAGETFTVNPFAADPDVIADGQTYDGSKVQSFTYPNVNVFGRTDGVYTAAADSSAAGSYTVAVTDNVDNLNDNDPDAEFTLVWDRTRPNPTTPEFFLSNPTAAYLSGSNTLYFGDDPSGTLTVQIDDATDTGSGMAHVAFPALFGQAAWNDTTAPYQQTYPLDGAQTTTSKMLLAVDNVGNTPELNPGLRVVKDTTAPSVSATASLAGSEITVTWNGTDNQAGVAHYDVQSSLDGETWTNELVDTTDTSATFSIAPSQTYTFRVRATDNVGNTSGWQTTASATRELTTTKYYMFGGQRVAMRVQDSSGSNDVYYLHGDHLGSVSLTTDASGNAVAQSRALPFGENRWSAGSAMTDFDFTGQRKESGFGLMDYNARYYAPGLGRFISADTIIPDPGSPQGFDRYAYVSNNPTNYTDPSGHCAIDNDGSSRTECNQDKVIILVCGFTDLCPEPPMQFYFQEIKSFAEENDFTIEWVTVGKYWDNPDFTKEKAGDKIIKFIDEYYSAQEIYIIGHSAGPDATVIGLTEIMENKGRLPSNVKGVGLNDASFEATIDGVKQETYDMWEELIAGNPDVAFAAVYGKDGDLGVQNIAGLHVHQPKYPLYHSRMATSKEVAVVLMTDLGLLPESK